MAAPAAIEIATASADETRALAARMSLAARAGDRIALVGPLGAGKTQFAKGFADGLGIDAVVNSPSFTLMAEYEGRLPMFHQDLYRLAGAEEAIAGGMLDERQDEGVTLTEWADRLPAEIDARRLTLRFVLLGGDQRRIGLLPGTPDQQRYVDAARGWQADVEAGR
ncbi:tRNA (adenosine(37)-N6)-threonylcarbamoyltransferase complex ATPase subunit type 1 TsaE [soil metagenome]